MKVVLIVLIVCMVNEYFSQNVRKKVYLKILNFDLGLSKNLSHPKRGEGEQMIRDIETFTDLLWETRDKIKAKNKTVIKEIQPFIPQKTPVFLSYPLNEAKVKSEFNWDQEDLDILFHVSKHAQVMWDELKYWFNKTVAGNETYYLQ